MVDDDSRIREALASLLSSAQFSAAAFGSAEEVLQSGLLAHASCLITDVRMPGMQGLELESRVNQEYPELPVFLITGHRHDQLEQREHAEGGVRLFYKPLNPDDLLDAIRTAIADPAAER